MNEILKLINPWWFKKPFETGIRRPIYNKKLISAFHHKRAVLLTGSRRVGKTTLFFQTIDELIKTVDPHRIMYVLLDHPQISSMTVFELLKEWRTYFSLDRDTLVYLFLDEIQYVKNWEQEVKALIDTEKVKIFLSGSASSELILKSHYLTGRIEKIGVYPLEFQEFIQFKKISIAETESYKYENLLDNYFKIGGYPEYVLNGNSAYIGDFINSILYKDIIRLYDVKNADLLRDLLLLLADRNGYQTTYTKLASILSLKNDTVKEYIYYLKNSFLVDELERYAESRNKRIYSAKKFYISDNGILFHLIGKINFGAAFERTLYKYLTFYAKHLSFYYENQKEADFVVERGGVRELWEAKYKLGMDFDRELDRYLKIASEIGARKMVIVTKDKEEEKTIKRIKVVFKPMWKLLVK